MKNVVMVRAYYENPDMLRRHLDQWATLPPTLRRFLSVILVDDGSPFHPALGVLLERPPALPLRLFRLEVDVRWNWLAARNIALKHAPVGSWCLITDMDHVPTEATLTSLVQGTHDRDTIYRFSRREHTGEAIHPHPNSWFMTREMFWQVGGHDEALSGYYGTDGEYRRRCAATATVQILSDELVRYERVGDSSTRGYLRKQPQDAAGKLLIKRRPRDWRPRVLSFPYHEERLSPS